MLIKEIPNEIAVDSSANGGTDLGNANQSLEDSINALKAQNQLITPSNSVESWRYALVIAILLMLIIALFIAKKRVALQKDAPSSAFPYFQKPQLRITQSIAIDARNRIVVLASKDAEYIIFVGQNGAFLIDKIAKKQASDLPKIIAHKENKIANLLKAYQSTKAQNAKIAQNQPSADDSESKSTENLQ